jgi:AraC-like DNA-binding protein/ABC-type Fe3+-hydroxamate transport system substrate-binding protein
MNDSTALFQSHTIMLTDVCPLAAHTLLPAPSRFEPSDGHVAAEGQQRRPGAAGDTGMDCAIALFPEYAVQLGLDGARLRLSQGTAVQLHPGRSYTLSADTLHGTVVGWLVRFRLLPVGKLVPALEGFPLLPYHQEIAVQPLASFCVVAKQLAGSAPTANESAALRKQAALLELLALLLDSKQRALRPTASEEAIERTIAYMCDHFTEPLTVEQLAAMSGIGRWQFSELFRHASGEKPLDFLNTLRLNRAKELLLLTDEPLREIARSVGFRDEYYFNRRFSRMFGCSPKHYARTHRTTAPLARQTRPLAGSAAASVQPDRAPLAPADGYVRSPASACRLIVCGGLLGDVLLLGFKPIAAALAVMGQQVVYRDLLTDIRDVGVSGEADKVAAAIDELRPDLVLLDKIGTDIARFAQVKTPIVSFGRTESAAVRLSSIAALLGVEERAAQWLKRHELQAEAMWRSMRSRIGTAETATVFVQVREQLYAMSAQGLAATLYHPRGFRPSEGAARLIAEDIRFREVEAHELADYDGDRVFLLASDEQHARQAIRKLTSSAPWRKLHACRFGNVHLAEAKWNYDDCLTRERLLPELPGILASRI